MRHSPWRVAGLLFFSGLCALIYQTVWLRQFRLIFGASTYATGAVLAIFMGGLGLGSALLGKRADAKERPLGYYANLELLIAAAAALSPALLWIAAKLYFASGGSPELGIAGATVLRLVLAVIVLGPATVLMGGTLPAAARAVETDDDDSRRAVALLYGVNTLGAVAGTLLSTFVMLETFGNRKTLLMAVLVNLVVGVVARSMARGGAVEDRRSRLSSDSGQAGLPVLHVYAASAVVGFAFLLMELVWYRMLSPVLGGTTYMFGLILAIALFGIGMGGAAYSLFRRREATAGAFAITCSLEALAIVIPFALGDRLAVLANVLRGLGAGGFAGHVVGWTMVTAIVVLPAACVAGIQFPLLIALLGRGRENVGREIGAAYAWNTAGAIAGALAGGFGILPLLSAPTTWRLVVLLLAALAIVFALRDRRWVPAGATFATAALAVACTFALGPTAVWRHGGIGAARAENPETRNGLRKWFNDARRAVVWERDGRESSIAVTAVDDTAFIVNGKSDGSARRDAETQVMTGLAGAILHPNPKTSLVIGLGTGSTAGWLGRVPSMERVDAIELEPVVLDVARACEAVNGGAMENPKVHITIADAREVLLATRRHYDLIASEPSNPYRAGIASLFTQEFYEAAGQRLNRGGLFLQWVQTYAIHADTMRTIYGTMTSVFPHVQTWWTSPGDLVLIASREPIVIDANALRARLAAEPYRTVVYNVWRADTAEAFLGKMLANEQFARIAAEDALTLNTDDRTVIEFGFARSIDSTPVVLGEIAKSAARLRIHQPSPLRGSLDARLLERNRIWFATTRSLDAAGNLGQLSMAALELAKAGDARVERYAELVGQRQPIERDVIVATLRVKQNRLDDAAALLHRALVAYRANPWPLPGTMQDAVRLALEVGHSSPARARLLHGALAKPFSVRQQEYYRRYALIALAARFDGCGAHTLAALRAVEPNPFWTRELLALRAGCYAKSGPEELAQRAWSELEEFNEGEPAPVIRPRSRPAPRGSS